MKTIVATLPLILSPLALAQGFTFEEKLAAIKLGMHKGCLATAMAWNVTRGG